MASHKPKCKNGAALPFRACPTFSDHVAVAGGQKEIDNTYGGPERERHSHEHDNKDRNFPLGYTFHFFPPASNRYLHSTLVRNISLPRGPRAAIANPAAKGRHYSRVDSRKASAGAIEGNKTEAAIKHRHKKKPRTNAGA